RLNIPRAPVDSWFLTYNRRGNTVIETDKKTINASAGTPFLWSLGERTASTRSSVDRIQLLIPRDTFRDIAPVLDMSRGSVLNTPLGQILGDYMLLLESRLGAVAANGLWRLTEAGRSMIAACVAPTAERAQAAANEIDYGRRERICRLIHARLRSSTLTPDALCKLAGVSRSQLYRL